ncbi:MAG: carbamoyltransferase [Candidatus Rickettsiella isopodorum]|nr:carbamoyltransferase [Candidatus Rickettsiella isopodorum]
MMKILGISAFYHDSAAALIDDGTIIAAAQEERFTRKKHDPAFPINSIKYCLEESHTDLSNIDFITFYEKPFLKFERLLETYLASAPFGFNSFRKIIPIWVKEKIFQKKHIINELKKINANTELHKKILFSEHHLSHAASAFYPSPFESAAVLVLDGVGEYTTSSIGVGNNSDLSILKEIRFPHSLGLLYAAFTSYIGFKVNSGEYKVMGLAPYGQPKYTQTILNNLIDIKPDGSFRLNMEYFNYTTDFTMTNEKFHKLFGSCPRQRESTISQREMDLAASIQVVLEKAVLLLATSIAKETQQKNLCLAGGVALNCVANSKIIKSKIFDKIWIQPASGDAGGAIGAALVTHHLFNRQPKSNFYSKDNMKGAYLGPSFSQEQIIKRLEKLDAQFTLFQNNDDIVKRVATLLAQNKTIGWFQGRAEFGPRALGNRSILANPKCPHMQKTLNLKIKYRESFRPFAASILTDDLEQWFDLSVTSPYMLLVANVNEEKRTKITQNQEKLFGIEKLHLTRSEISAVTHVDYSSRIQTVDKETNPIYYALLDEFKKITNCPILVNTSFNIRGEPIVNTPEEAFHCFINTELDYLVMGYCLLNKQEQTIIPEKNYKDKFELD